MEFAIIRHLESMNSLSKLLVLIYACSVGCTDVDHKSSITKVSFASSERPFMAIEVDSSLKYKYYGGAHAEKKGYYYGKLSEADWINFNDLLDSLDYSNIDTGFNGTINEDGVELIIQLGDNKRQYFGSVDKRDSLYKAYDWLIESIQKVNLVKSNDTLKFQTRYQYPPTPKTPDTLKFLPPSLH
jgi:hypothetical protein